MRKENLKIALFVFINIILFGVVGNAQIDKSEKHMLVSLRMIGHKILLNSGDSTSQVLPIKKEADQYKIQFTSEFQFIPEELVALIDSVVKKTNIAKSYIVEVEHSETGKVFYSYEIGDSIKADIIPCGIRIPPKGNYDIVITILDPVSTSLMSSFIATKNSSIIFSIVIFIISALLLIAMYKFFGRKIVKTKIDPNMVNVGEFQFDTINSELLHQNQRVPLSSKESGLLLLLYSAANTTIEREVILQKIWGDEGDYIGRTLDVFISKLRKKLEDDASLKIVNIRGIGYKLLTNINSQR